MAKQKATVLMVREGKNLVLSNNKYFIVKGDNAEGDNIEFDTDAALPMPSYMFGIAAMEEENLDETLDFIQSKWFKKN
ncbi:MAG: hypothetical protein WCR67_00800 [Bacilli bacterium]